MPRLIGGPPDIAISFEERRVLVRLGYRKPVGDIDPGIRLVVHEEAENAKKLVRPRVLAAILDSAEFPDHPIFRNAEKAALCLCTIGPELEGTVARLMSDGDMLRGLVLDWLGSEAVACVSKQAEAWLKKEGSALGLWPGKRFAPGYKGWDVSGQKLIFAVLPAAEIGVSLTESFMMMPRKSYSFRVNYFRDKALATGKQNQSSEHHGH
jgi:hypothetical protein